MGSGLSTVVDCPEESTYNITEADVPSLIFTPVDIAMAAYVIPIILCLGVITNCTFLFMVFRVPKMRTDTNIYLSFLALADLLYLHCTAVFKIWQYWATPLRDHQPFKSEVELAALFIVTNAGYYASTLLVTMVSVERYLALCHPIKHLKVRGRRRTYRFTAICWLVGIVLAGTILPRVVRLHVNCLLWPDNEKYDGFPSSMAYPGPANDWVWYLVVPLTNITWLIVLIANVYMDIRIIRALSKRKTDHRASRTRNQVAKMLVVNGAVFFICQSTYPIIDLIYWISAVARLEHNLDEAIFLEWVFITLELLNTVVNPLIYGTMNAQYRTAFVQAFRCKRRKHKDRSVNSQSLATITETSTA
ncbi:neuromedin-U receptor 2-like [Patiria miniata]|uniref:G-protein coupled receptors family 1 profile domain-containing protein n=1 Tax=Patiria miniata TaxID=46514 RepID=A0A913YWD6_PATMI|nr:neuromedin-U receptor 2-like [Patiria miniata]XP_038044110.1 neuromedin-U receptor 2-like [Patiria miniata]